MSSSGRRYDPIDVSASTADAGIHFEPPTSYEPYRRIQDDDALTRLASLDLTSTRNTQDTYDTWTELEDYSTNTRRDSDVKILLQSRIRRSSTTSSVSSDSTIIYQPRTVQWLEDIGEIFSAFWKLPVIRHVLFPFKWLVQQFSDRLKRTRFHGWRMGILLSSIMSSLVLAVNVAVLIYGATQGKGFEGGFAVPMSGVAEEVSWWSSAIHIAINALSTILLAASNYTMQVLSSPTRKDIDKAHARNEWLDIGVLSVRNLTRIPRRRLALFFIMGLTSIPIHLFYNSAVFYIGANNQYHLNVVEVGSTTYQNIYNISDLATVPSDNTNERYDAIKVSRWSRVYDTALVGYGDLYLAVDYYRSEIDNDTLTGWPNNYPNIPTETLNRWDKQNVTYKLNATLTAEFAEPALVRRLKDTFSTSEEWIRFDNMLTGVTNSRELVNNTGTDVPKFAHVSHAFAKRLDTASRIQLSLVFLIIVIVCNSFKLLTMIWVVFAEKKEYVVTLGDGVASFLEKPDPVTERMCILSKQEIADKIVEGSSHILPNDPLSKLVSHNSRTWTKQYSTYSNALNRDREIGSYFIFIVIGILFGGLIATVTTLSETSTTWGTKSTTTFRRSSSSPQQTLLNAWIANAPQLVLSFFYLAINSECTAMAGAAEWNSLATSRKGLRVTRPCGQQRDTYFLQLPYKWSLPLTAASGGLHWLLNQSIFLVRIDTYNRSGQLITTESQSACGFSPLSWLTLTGCFFALVGIVGLIGRKKIMLRIPFAASSSFVVSAACHPGKEDDGCHLERVQWGVVEKRMFEGEEHCTLSARKVEKPKVGKKYL